MDYHNPVLLNESVEGLNIKSDGIYVDVTFGGGGHSKAILEKLGESGKLIAFDQDIDALKNVFDDKRFTLVNQNFKFMQQYLKYYNAVPVDGILADLGVSSHQFDTAERGFSTRFESELDMRMNKSLKKTAAKILNEYDDEHLQKIFSEYGEIHNSKTLAQTITSYRKENKLKSTDDLKQAIAKCLSKRNEQQYYAQVFQALRIEVNDELGALKDFLKQSQEVLKSGGRLAVITYHSLEDRLVKNFISKGNFEGEAEKDFYGNVLNISFKAITKKPVIPSAEEIKNNSRARSAKLRIAEKI